MRCKGVLFGACLLWPFMLQAAEPAPQKQENYTQFYTGKKKDDLKPFLQVLDELPPHYRNFVLNYRLAKTEQDVELLNSLFHPASLICDEDWRADYYAGLREFYLTETLPKSFDILFQPIPEAKQWPLKQKLELPVAPTHVMYIEYAEGEYREGLQRYLREEQEPAPRLYEVLKCPSRRTIEAMREAADVAE